MPEESWLFRCQPEILRQIYDFYLFSNLILCKKFFCFAMANAKKQNIYVIV